VPDRTEQQLKKTGNSESRFPTPPVMYPLPSPLKKKDDDQFVILTPQVIPNPNPETGPGTGMKISNSDLLYDSDNLSFTNPMSRRQMFEHVIRNQLRKGK
jgi:hypothetical protein